MKEPKKTQARAAARSKMELGEKWEAVRYGEVTNYPEYTSYFFALFLSDGIQKKAAVEKIKELTWTAIQRGDFAFFGRMAKLAQHFAKPAVIADELGNKVMEACVLLDFQQLPVTVGNVTKVFNRDKVDDQTIQFHDELIGKYTERQIRGVMKGLGLLSWEKTQTLLAEGEKFLADFLQKSPTWTEEECARNYAFLKPMLERIESMKK